MVIAKETDRTGGRAYELKNTGGTGGGVELEETGRTGGEADELVEIVMISSKVVSFASVRLV